ncbi:DUF1653 domain-containing protein [Candidatus Dojkabacteria bacterium]|jgi:hypothetical protein|nr:DUF1653 domain-containing protein [Candidatus Dojkabacteria bacterium]
MEKKTPEVLRKEMEEGEKQVPAGSLWAHFKSPDKYYEVLGFVVIEETGEIGVSYKSTFEPTKDITFVCVLEKFLGYKETDNGKVKRFTQAS